MELYNNGRLQISSSITKHQNVKNIVSTINLKRQKMQIFLPYFLVSCTIAQVMVGPNFRNQMAENHQLDQQNTHGLMKHHLVPGEAISISNLRKIFRNVEARSRGQIKNTIKPKFGNRRAFGQKKSRKNQSRRKIAHARAQLADYKRRVKNFKKST